MTEPQKEKLLISACLVGESCRYDGKHNKINALPALEEKFCLYPICPEQEGGLPTPRLVAELQDPAERILDGGGKVKRIDGLDVTVAFVKGAEAALNLCQKEKIGLALLKERSPSCGTLQVYDGNFSQKLLAGNGITTALLQRNQIRCISSDKTNILLQGEESA
jgi:uncharacterized protein YbbK (DUF523 family)